MKIINDFNKVFFIFFSILPLSIVVGPSISLLNILILVLMYFHVFFYKNHYKILKNSNVLKLLFLIYLYLILNSILSINYEISLTRNLGFIRLILLFITINYFFSLYQNNLKILNFWSIVITIFVLDVYLERFTGTNMFGWGAQEINGIPQPNGSRVVSFFKEEPIAGAYLNGFIFLILGYLISKIKKEEKLKIIFTIILIAIFYFSVVITGERSNSIKATFGIFLFFGLLDFVKTRYKILLFTAFVGAVILVVSSSDYLKNRYFGQIYSETFLSSDSNFFQDNIYLKLYKSGLNVFKNYPFFGVGNKNYRIESCKDKKDIIKYDYQCTTHPHQIYIEFLAEHGILGTLILLSIFFFLIFKNLKIIILSKNYIQLGCFINLLINFTPLLPSGSFFSDFNITLFFINFSLMYALNKKTNIFFVDKKN